MILPLLIASIVAVGLVSGLLESAHCEECPATAAPPLTTSAPSGWQAWRFGEARELKLEGISFSDGPPEHRVFLNPNSIDRQKDKLTEAFDFTSTKLGEIWFICRYEGSDIGYIKQTEFRGKQCDVIYSGRRSQKKFDRITCRIPTPAR